MLMVIFDARPGTWPRSLSHRMSVVNTKHPITVRIVQRQRVIKTMWPFGCYRHSLDDEFHQIGGDFFNYGLNDSIQFQQCVEAWVVLRLSFR
jgi:hypothetical protein